MSSIIQNRKAYHEYFIIEDLTAGIILKGPEVKSLRNGDANINESFGFIHDGNVYIKNMHISNYSNSIEPHEELRDKKLLLKKSEINKLSKIITKSNGITLIPLEVFISKNKIKVRIGVCKGKKTFDKRESKKEKDIKRETEKDLKFNK